ncbi:MAG TPA: methyltransferase [Anaerolineae bacterium]|nr:methyltransferase [Anaerolineae bacterium]
MTDSPVPSAAANAALPPLRIHDSVGVCGVRNDTRLLAEIAAGDGAPGRALDLGAGTGYVGLYLAQRGWQVDAVDISPRAVELAQANAERNGLAARSGPGGVRVYRSNLFDQVDGPFDVIAFNPPMRPDETELSRIVTSLLRRSPRVSAALMRLAGARLEGSRSPFLAAAVARARGHLRLGGRLVLAISDNEASELARLPGAQRGRSWPIPDMPRHEIVEFSFSAGSDAAAPFPLTASADR